MATDYPNRSDLRNPMQQAKFTGQTYGQATQQAQSQQAVPSAASPTDNVPVSQPAPMPGQITDLTGTTERPNEPMTAGMDFGDGPNSGVFGASMRPDPGSNMDLAERVRAIASIYPNPALLQLLMDLQE